MCPYPVDKLSAALGLTKEAYDYRMEDGDSAEVPPTLIDAFICDLWNIITEEDLKIKLNPSEITKNIILDSFHVYLDRNWDAISGLRPWTHWNFLRSLSKGERNKLASEVVAYIKKNGVICGKNI